MDARETDLKTEVQRIARYYGWKIYSATWGQVGRVQRGAKGYPDLTLARRGVTIWLELKKEGEKPTPEQVEWGDAIGSRWFVIYPHDLQSGLLETLLR